MKKVEFINPKNHTIHLVGPDKTQISIAPHAKVVLSEWFQKYAPNYLRVLRVVGDEAITKVKPQPRIQQIKPVSFSGVKAVQSARIQAVKPVPIKNNKMGNNVRIVSVNSKATTKRTRNRRDKIVGHTSRGDFNMQYIDAINSINVPISNNIGVGILSYDRPEYLQRLLNSIVKNTDITRTTIFVSDESTDKSAIVPILESFAGKIVVLNNASRLGVAGNSNRLLKCLDRFAYKFLLNDDVEILSPGWEDFYIKAMNKTGIHHFCFREPGIYGANAGTESLVNGCNINTVIEKPHGAFLVFDDLAFKKVGYFDEKFGLFGMEHVDWSNRVSMSGIQLPGYHDVGGSMDFIKMNNAKSEVQGRTDLLNKARHYFASVSSNHSRIYVDSSPASNVPSISVVIPYRQEDRRDDLVSVISNIKAARFPRVDIIISEQDQTRRLDLTPVNPITYHFVGNATNGQAFNKAAAFNVGVFNTNNDKIILHDADIMVSGDYVAKVFSTLDEFEGCHLGSRVFYLNEASSQKVNDTGHLSTQYQCERVVGYFEGGTLGCRRATYAAIGGFNEGYIGYGIEDCDFFERLSTITKFNENRTYNLFHLHHRRTPGWEACHEANKKLEAQLRSVYPNIKEYAAHLRTKLSAKYELKPLLV